MHSNLKTRAIAVISAAALSLTLFACGSGGYKKNPQPMPGGPYGMNQSTSGSTATGR
jgi:hypothetical protein